MVFSMNLISFVKNDSYGSKKNLMLFSKKKKEKSYVFYQTKNKEFISKDKEEL